MKCRHNDPEFEKMFRTPGGKPCSRLAVLYHWAQPETDRRAQVIVSVISCVTHALCQKKSFRKNVFPINRQKTIHFLGTLIWRNSFLTEERSQPIRQCATVQVVVRSPARKISASLALEKKMLSIVDVFAIFPCPWFVLSVVAVRFEFLFYLEKQTQGKI